MIFTFVCEIPSIVEFLKDILSENVLGFSLHYLFAKSSEYILKQHLLRFPYMRCKLCTHRCVCVGTINTSFTEELVSWNLRIELSFYGFKV